MIAPYADFPSRHLVKTIYHPAYAHLVQTLQDARQHLRLSQAAVARAVGMRRQWVSKIENCDLRIDVLMLVRLCRIYRIPAAKLVRQMEEELSLEDDFSLRVRVEIGARTLHVDLMLLTADFSMRRARAINFNSM